MSFDDSLGIMKISYLMEVSVEHLQLCIFKLFCGTQQTIPRDKSDCLVDLEKPIKTGRLSLALGQLIGLVRFRTFLTIGKYYKKPVSLLKFEVGKNFEVQAVSKINLPIKSHR